jgi:hypothetical protein
MNKIRIIVDFDDVNDLNSVEAGLLYSEVWRWFEFQDIKPKRLVIECDPH